MKPFYQVDSALNRKHEGAGLGLALTKRFIELMGGDFVLEGGWRLGRERSSGFLRCMPI